MARTTSFKQSGNYSFAQVPGQTLPRSQFDRSHGLKTTFDAGYLIPIYWDEALPGDTFTLRMSSIVRLATPIYPIMDNIYVDYFFFSVANRLVWENWQKFCGEQVDPGDSTDYSVPQSTVSTAHGVEDLESYFGIPYGQGNVYEYNTLHLRAYNLIFREWFRDENLTDSPTVQTDDGPDGLALYQLLKRAKRHDYFTSCLPWTQKGTAVELPLGTSAPVESDATGLPLFDVGGTTDNRLQANAGDSDRVSMYSAVAGLDDLQWGSATGLQADLDGATAATINQLREAFQVQKMLERDARGGTRYVEILRSHFGITNHPDARLQRPEYLGGGSVRMNVAPVAATSGYATAPDLGTLGAFATQIADGIGFHKSFVEHSLVIGLASVRSDMTYQQGMERMWFRQDRYDYYWPALAHLGEQAVYNKEIYWSATPATDDAAFGYQERYAEYRYKPSRVTGKMHSNATGSLDPWHLAFDFASLPGLNNTFIEEDPPIDRVIAVSSEPHCIGDFWFNLKCARPMPTFSVPGLIDHF